MVTLSLDQSIQGNIQKDTKLWIKDASECWVAGICQNIQNQTLYVQIEKNGENLQVDYTQVLPRNATLNEECTDDLTSLAYLHEASVLNTIRTRYSNGDIYTYSGIVLVAVNPYQRLSIYEREIIHAHHEHQRNDLTPHLFAIIEEAFQSLCCNEKNQSIIVSGESGAGKTISAKYIMRYLAEICSLEAPSISLDSNAFSVEEKILATNPILEAFGNAKTVKNDNSSRFGKYIQIFFDKTQHFIIGAAIKSYLLEKTRIVSQAAQERNFHIFYQLLAGCPEKEREQLGLLQWADYRYLSSLGVETIDNVNDFEEFSLTRKALSITGFTDDHQWNIFRLLVAILTIGNVAFTNNDNDYAIINDQEILEKIANLLELPVDNLSNYLTKRKILAAGDSVDAFNTPLQAEAAREALAKQLYSALFNHIIEHLNKNLAPPSSTSPTSSASNPLFIGVLDIYGFEKFPVNSFEQFCINYANEKLQSMFNAHVFDLEQKLYEQEEIDWQFVNFANNQPCIDLIEGKLGILDLLDEECRFPNGSDTSFLNKLVDCHSKTKVGEFLLKSKVQATGAFTIKHFAYDVEYTVDRMLEKNRDSAAPDQLQSLLQSSDDQFLTKVLSAGFGKPVVTRLSSSIPDTPSKKTSKDSISLHSKQTTGSLFKQSLAELMDTLYSTKVHYIRCIKPNESKTPFTFEASFVAEQLWACGILETIRISAAGFPGRWPFNEFLERFSLLAADPVEIRNSKGLQKACKDLLGEFDLPKDDFQIGKTKVFMKAGVLAVLEIARTTKLDQAVIIIQSQSRMRMGYLSYKLLISSAKLITTLTKRCLASKILLNLKTTKAVTFLCSNLKRFQAIKTLLAIAQNSLRITTAYRQVLSTRKVLAVKNNAALELIKRYVEYYQSRRTFTSMLHIALAMQSKYRRNVAWLSLLKLREESRSLEHMKENSSIQECKILELCHKLKLAEEHLTFERNVNATLNKQLEEALAEAANFKTNQSPALETIKAELEETKLCLDSYQSIMENLETSNEELFKRNEELARQLKIARLESLNADHTSGMSSSKQSLSNIILRDAVTPPRTLKHLRNFSYDSKIDHLSRMALPKIPQPIAASPSSIYNLSNKSTELVLALNDSACLAELLQVVSMPSINNDDTFLPSKILSLWIVSWLRVGSNADLAHTFMCQVLAQIKMNLIGSGERKKSYAGRPIDADAKMSYWIANMFDFLCTLQHIVLDFMQSQKNSMLNQSRDPEVPSDHLIVLMQIRTDVARIVEELCRVWLADLFRVFIKLGVSALLDHQGLSGFGSDQASPMLAQKSSSSSSSLAFLMMTLSKLSTRNKPEAPLNNSIDDLTNGLTDLARDMQKNRLQPEIAMQIMSAIINNICFSAFNQLILRKNYATWKRGIQVQYNISRLEEWTATLNASQPAYFFSTSILSSPNEHSTDKEPTDSSSTILSSSNSPSIIYVEPLIQAVKLLQLAKTRATNDIDTLIAACPRLSLSQIRKVLSVYVPDAYEDGPVAPQVLQSITARLHARGKPEFETLPEIQPQVLPLQLSIKPIPPVALSQLLSTLIPPHLWKIFSLIESCDANQKT